MRNKSIVNCSLGNWDYVKSDVTSSTRFDVYRDVLFWSTKLILTVMGGGGVCLSPKHGSKGNPPYGFLIDESRNTMLEVEDREIWELYEFFYGHLTTDIPMDHDRAHGFCQYMQERVDVIHGLRCPVGMNPDERTMELIAMVFTGANDWAQPPSLDTLWSVDFIPPAIPSDHILIWRKLGPPLRGLMNAFDGLFNRLVGLASVPHDNIDFLVRYGHDFNYPRYVVPTTEQMRYGIGLRIEDLHLFPHQDLVAKALASELCSEGVFTMVMPRMGVACEYSLSRITDESYRVDTMVSSNQKPYPRWVQQAFPDKRY